VHLTYSSSALAFLTEKDFSFESLFAIWSLSLQRFTTAIEPLNHSDTCAVPSVCNRGRFFAHLTQALHRLHLSSAAGDKGIGSYHNYEYT